MRLQLRIEIGTVTTDGKFEISEGLLNKLAELFQVRFITPMLTASGPEGNRTITTSLRFEIDGSQPFTQEHSDVLRGYKFELLPIVSHPLPDDDEVEPTPIEED